MSQFVFLMNILPCYIAANDTCVWPPPYPENCTSIGNHEFTIIDQLNLGARGIEIDNWWCYDAVSILLELDTDPSPTGYLQTVGESKQNIITFDMLLLISDHSFG